MPVCFCSSVCSSNRPPLRYGTSPSSSSRSAARWAGCWRKALVEQPQQEVAVEGEELAPCPGAPGHPEAILEVVCVAVEKTFALDEVDEHQPVEHERGVPFSVALLGDALDERQERCVLSLEMVVEASGDPVAVKGITQAEDTGQGDALFFVQ